MAIIGLEQVRFYAYHGYYEEENLTGGEFELDVFVETPTTEAAEADDLGETVNYETIFFICQSEMKKPRKLIETVAQSILDRLANHFEEKLEGIKVKIKKIAPPMDGRIGFASVEVSIGTLNETERAVEILKDMLDD